MKKIAMNKTELVPVSKDKNDSLLDILSPNRQERIQSIELKIRGKLETIKRNIFEIGQLLSTARIIIGDEGSYQSWIKERFADELPYSTAALYKKIYDRYPHNPKMIQYIPVSILLRLVQKDFPERVIKLFEDDPEGYGKSVNIKKFKESADDYKKGRITEYEFWAETKGCVDFAFDLLSKENQKKKFDVVLAKMRSGFSKINIGMSLIAYYKLLPPPPPLRNFYNKLFDEKIANLQKLKVEFNDAVDNFQESKAFPSDISKDDKSKVIDV